MTETDSLAVEAKADRQKLNLLVQQSEYFILKSASAATHRYITKNDDEWSIALHAFIQAIDRYELKKGSFLAFANLVISRRLIDYLRAQCKHGFEISVDPSVFNAETENEPFDYIIAQKTAVHHDDSISLEITTLNEQFGRYGFSFFDLIQCSPKAGKTKAACAKVVNYLLSSPQVIQKLRQSEMLPVKLIEQDTGISQKILERHRKYIIAAVEILSGDYPYLAGYLQFIREENKK